VCVCVCVCVCVYCEMSRELDKGVLAGGERGSLSPTMLLLAGFPQERVAESLHLVAAGVPSTESRGAEASLAFLMSSAHLF
jgi:hypothetical protein